MAARLRVLRRTAAALVVALLVLSACTNPERASIQADEVPLPTPLRSFDASVGATIAQVESALGTVGARLVDPTVAYRPSEPESMLQLPRVVRRADLADRDDGYVVIYEAEGRSDALARARDLADYLGSGFGQSNYVADTQFSVSVLGDTVIFTTWSRGRSDDPDRAETVFDAIATVGEPVPVAK